MLDAIDFVLRAQNFHSRIASYQLIKKLDNNEVSERWLAKHRLTGEKFMIKQAPREPEDDPIRELAMNEIRVL